MKLFVYYLLTIPAFALAQSEYEISGIEMFNQDLQKTAEGIIYVSSQPFHWSENDFIILGGTLAGGTLLFMADNDINNFFKRNHSKIATRWARIGSNYGEPLTVVSLTAALYIFGIVTGDDWTRETAVILTSALIPAGAIQTISKLSAGRARPYMELGKDDFKFWRKGEDYYSFVSGHTLVAMSTSLVLAKRIKNNYASTILFGVAGLCAWSRMYLNNHFSSDVFLGSALSFATVFAAFSAHSQNATQAKNKESVKYVFNTGFNRIGFQIYF
ncbi:MAG: phosphatase PAP2 family protein [Calditrichae bacterium]|nr:phosphatase PAP2 family protein [Calditrichota bacterium]MCB9059283.1 phosphatase PAP2 family protein [Calditrichia bacterium]